MRPLPSLELFDYLVKEAGFELVKFIKKWQWDQWMDKLEQSAVDQDDESEESEGQVSMSDITSTSNLGASVLTPRKLGYSQADQQEEKSIISATREELKEEEQFHRVQSLLDSAEHELERLEQQVNLQFRIPMPEQVIQISPFPQISRRSEPFQSPVLLQPSSHAKLTRTLKASRYEIQRLNAEIGVQSSKIQALEAKIQSERLERNQNNINRENRQMVLKQIIIKLQQITEAHSPLKGEEGLTRFRQSITKTLKRQYNSERIREAQTSPERLKEQNEWKAVANLIFKELQSIAKSHQRLIESLTSDKYEDNERQSSRSLVQGGLLQIQNKVEQDDQLHLQQLKEVIVPSLNKYSHQSEQKSSDRRNSSHSQVDIHSAVTFERQQSSQDKKNELKVKKQTIGDNYDYAHVHRSLLLKHSDELENDLNSLNQAQNPQNGQWMRGVHLSQHFASRVLSARVDYLKDFKTKEQRIFYVRGKFAYFFMPDNLVKRIKFKLSKIKKLCLIRHSSELLLIQLHDYHPYLLQSLFCYQIILFLSYQLKRLGLPLIKPQLKAGLLLTKKGSYCNGILPVDEESKSFINESALFSQNSNIPTKLEKMIDKFSISNALKRGIAWVLKKNRGSLAKKEWKELTIVLSKIGLLLFENLSDQWPYFYPLGSACCQDTTSQSLPGLPKKMQQHFGGVKSGTCLDLLEITHLDLAPLIIAFNSEREREEWESAIFIIQENKRSEELKVLKLSRKL